MSLPNTGMDAVPFTPITSEWGDDIIENIEALAAGTGLDDGAVTGAKIGMMLGCRATRSSVLSIANNSGITITWNSEAWDNGGFFSGSGTDIIIPSGQNGLYRISLYTVLASNGTGVRHAEIRVNAVGTGAMSMGASEDPAGLARIAVSIDKELSVGDVITGAVFQNSGGALNLAVTAFLTVVKIGTVA